MSEAPCEVRVENVRRVFAGRAAVDDITLTAPAGKVTALLGASGSGKSTLLRMIAGLEPVDGGRILLGDTVVSTTDKLVPAEARRIGFVFQDFALFPHMTAAQNVAFGLSEKERSARVKEATAWLDRVGLAHRAEAYPHELSGGEQQRVALARALAPRPRAVLLDEPFSGLDPTLRAELRDRTLDAIASIEATALFVTHDADEALYVADQIAILREGRLVQAASPRVLYDQPASPEAAAALGATNRFDGAVRNGILTSPFGGIASAAPDGPATGVVRAEALTFASSGAPVRVVARRPQGAYDLVMLEAGGVIWRGHAAPGEGPDNGGVAHVAIRPAGAFVFPR
jgi:iron(III) transport system ATP-binding protein